MPDITKSILIVEDEDAAREILVKKLSAEGFAVFPASNGEEALSVIAEKAVDLIILDLYMPVMDGQTFLRNLRKLPKGEQLPVIVLSNVVTPDNVVSAFDRNIVDYLLKTNVGLDALVSRVKTALGL